MESLTPVTCRPAVYKARNELRQQLPFQEVNQVICRRSAAPYPRGLAAEERARWRSLRPAAKSIDRTRGELEADARLIRASDRAWKFDSVPTRVNVAFVRSFDNGTVSHLSPILCGHVTTDAIVKARTLSYRSLITWPTRYSRSAMHCSAALILMCTWEMEKLQSQNVAVC